MTSSTTPDPAVIEHPLGPDGEVEILLTSNDLRLRGTDRDGVVVRARDGRSLEGEIIVEEAGRQLRVRDDGAAFRLGPLRMRTGHPVDLDVDIPRTARVSVRTLSGSVDARGIGGSSRWATASGDLRVEVEAGPVALESMSGDITLDAGGTLEVTARSVSGDLRLRAGRIDALNASTTSGDLEIDAALGDTATHTISSVSGDVRLATDSEVRLEAQTVSGDIRSSLPHRAEGGRGSRTLVVGTGRVRVSARTMSGDVMLRGAAASDGRPAPVAPPVPAAPPAPVVPPTPPTPPAPGEPPVVVAEATAAPNLVRVPPAPAPVSPVDADVDAGLGTVGTTDRREAARLEVLRALERGDLDVEAASRRLQALEEAGPRYFRGWC